MTDNSQHVVYCVLHHMIIYHMIIYHVIIYHVITYHVIIYHVSTAAIFPFSQQNQLTTESTKSDLISLPTKDSDVQSILRRMPELQSIVKLKSGWL